MILLQSFELLLIFALLALAPTYGDDVDLEKAINPWSKRKGAEKPQAFGFFITIWKRQADGVWSVVLDVGTNHPQPKEPAGEVKTLVPDFPIAHAADSIQQRLQDAEKNFTESLAIRMGLPDLDLGRGIALTDAAFF
jgi:hypothetical protein